MRKLETTLSSGTPVRTEVARAAPVPELTPTILKILQVMRDRWFTVEELANALGVSKGSAYHYIGKLSKLGLLEKRPVPEAAGHRYHYRIRIENLPKELLRELDESSRGGR